MTELLIETMPAEETETPEPSTDSLPEHLKEFEETLDKVIPILAKYAPQLYQAVFTGIKPLIQHEIEMRLWADAYFDRDLTTSSGREEDATKALAAFRKAFPKE